MIQGGSSADTLFCEAKLKGLTGIDYEKALRFMRKNNEVESPDPYLYGRYLAPYRDLGFVKNGIINCVSRHLEYTYQDWCIGRLADGLGQPEVAAHYYTSSRKVWNLWKESIRSFAPRNEDGQWVEPFDPTKCRRDSWNDPYFYEGTSLGWSFNVQHDFAGLIRRHGGPEAFVAHLDRYFDSGHSCTKEVFMHIPQLYTYAGRPDCTSARLWNVLHERYSTRRNGIPDNEDMGCHSAFYMCSSMGLYPIMGQDLYLLSTPFFERTEIELGDPGRTLVIEAPQAGGRCRHIQAATLNGVPLNRAWLRHAEIAHGGTLRLELADRPSAWGTTQPPPSPLDGSAP
jgi:predicted alpha-1,2-mannosidase